MNQSAIRIFENSHGSVTIQYVESGQLSNDNVTQQSIFIDYDDLGSIAKALNEMAEEHEAGG